MTKKENEFNRLNFEDWIIIIIITLNVINIFSNQLQKKYLETDEINYLNNSSIIFIFTLIITAFIYIYFIKRNINFLLNNEALKSILQFYNIMFLLLI